MQTAVLMTRKHKYAAAMLFLRPEFGEYISLS